MRNVVITGASRGLGLAMARAVADAGFRVIAVARKDSAELGAARAEEANGRGAIEFRAADLSDLASIHPFVRALCADFGPLWGLVNNAGIGTAGVLGLMRDDDIEAVVRLNTLAPIMLTKYVARSMMSERSGRIVNVSSIVASTGYAGLSVYSATKASLIGFTRSLARELGQLGITVNAIAPGFIDTDMTKELTGAERERIARRSALRRMAEPQDVAGAVAFLLSEAGRNITGTVMTIDAGNTT
ncbi:MAG: SDR family NAD(P)-dependent oxidoreductase [Gammaproteobacteria bacterium]|nr:SDR family NAD(P)-dependent oxidoreductase [Gammaproteobacteria bacterium]